MKKIALLFALLLLGLNAYAAPRVIRTYQPIPYNRGVNPFVRPCPSCGSGYYYNGYTPRYYNNYNHHYNSYNNRYYPTHYNNTGYNTYTPTQNVNVFDRFHNLNRTIQRNNYYPGRTTIYRLNRSDISNNIKPVSFTTDSKDQRLTLVEKNIYGKSFEHQEVNLRLNRLEKSMFNKTYPSLSNEERIENLFVNYNYEVRQAIPQELSDMENCVFKKVYAQDDDLTRVSRLESEVLGAIQRGNLNNRMNTLKNAIEASNVKSPYGTCYGGYMPQMNSNSGIKNTLSKLGDMFGGGCPTGLSPQIPPYDTYHFGLQDSGNSDYNVDNYGYYFNNTQRSSGTGIRILD